MANAAIVAGLGYGDEGKGAVVSFLTEQLQAKLVVRFNGGAQAAHNVVTPDGRHHTFAQFGSGTFSGCPTLLSRHVLINPGALFNEASHLESIEVPNPLELLHVEEDALVTTPFQVATNRIKEIWRGGGRHGSCGMGIFETVKDSIERPDLAVRAKDLRNPECLRERLEKLRCFKMLEAHEMVHEIGTGNEHAAREWDLLCDLGAVDGILNRWAYFPNRVKIVDPSWLADHLKKPGTVLFEGAQGILLDENWGFFPYATRSDTTFRNALALIEGSDASVLRIGVTRAHMTRHGAGPFVTEDSEALPFAAGDHNKFGPWQQNFRVGWMDLVAIEYACKASCDDGHGPDSLVVTHMDKSGYLGNICTAYESPNFPDQDLFEAHGRKVTAVRIKPSSLARQEQITQALLKMKPIMARARDEAHFLTWLEERLQTPVKILGRGSSWKDYSRVTS